MSEVERRRRYVESRVLMSSAAILNPTFDDGDLYFTGSQIEIMRNLVQYANRPENYAAEWELGYYLTPDNDDWDDIQAIVADLEETLMGNPNTLWGYADRWAEYAEQVSTGGVATNVLTATIPAGTVHKLEGLTIEHNDTVARSMFVAVVGDGVTVQIYKDGALAPNITALVPADYTLKAGDVVQCTVWSLADTKWGFLNLWGSKMVVPT